MDTMRLDVGAATLTIDSRGIAVPGDAAHLVDGSWHAACGAGRMRFRFPSLPRAGAGLCRKCRTAVKASAAA